MKREKKFLLVVPADSSRIRKFRVRPFFICLCVAVLGIGLASYFLPFGRFSITETEKRQKDSLERQNRALSEHLFNTLKLFESLRANVGKIEGRKQDLEGIAGLEPVVKQRLPRGRRAGQVKIDSLLEFVQYNEKFFSEIAFAVQKQPSLLHALPIISPVAPGTPISYRFGKRIDPFTGDEKWHNGVDFVAPQETPVISPATGIVSMTEDDRQWGKRIKIRHGNGFSTVYAHLGSVKVRAGTAVKKGQTIGTIGISGQTIGPHLHYEIHFNDKPIDPLQVIFPAADSIFSVENRGKFQS
jgi:murein DD-endopeptidase MepM/ murein hydrolase activator NlpD